MKASKNDHRSKTGLKQPIIGLAKKTILTSLLVFFPYMYLS